MARYCYAPSEFLKDRESSFFGKNVAEPAIQEDYLENVGRAMVYPDPPYKDCFDENRGIANYRQYVFFLRHHHRREIPDDRVWFTYMGLVEVGDGHLSVPDIITYDIQGGLPRRIEFYEIKPNSPTGINDGNSKIPKIDALLTSLRAEARPGPILFWYRPGVQYSPNKEKKIFSATVFGIPVDLKIHFRRVLPGLIVYEVCVESELLEAIVKIIVALLLALLILLIRIILRGGPLPGPRPLPGGAPGPAVA